MNIDDIDACFRLIQCYSDAIQNHVYLYLYLCITMQLAILFKKHEIWSIESQEKY